MSKPLVVASGDIHFTPGTLELATSVLSQMIQTSKEKKVPILLNGDILDTKAIIRAECSNRLISILEESEVLTIVNNGNHDLLHQKSKDSSLNFLRPYAQVVVSPVFISSIQSYVIPYQDSLDKFIEILKDIPYGSRIFIHQGIAGADLGHYVQDSSAVPKDLLSDYRTIASHYHKAQDIKTGRPRKGALGLASFLGSPYTQSFGEANDPPKGYAVLYDNGILERIPTKLRKHVIIERTYDRLDGTEVGYTLGDLVWLKVYGTRSELAKLNKAEIAKNMFFGDLDFKLDLIYTDSAKVADKMADKSTSEVLDALIDAENETDEQKAYLKQIWRDLCG